MSSVHQVRLGVLSDTHDRFDAALPGLFAGVDFILHAGDVIGPGILEQLSAIAPVRAVRGNNDVGEWADSLPAARVERFLGVPVLMLHILGTVEEPTLAAQFLIEAEKPRVVISGHSHTARLQLKDDRLFFNPGSAGPARFKSKPAAGLLTFEGGRIHAQLFALLDGTARPVESQTLEGRL